ncbi:MAG: RNase adapter RapZ [Alphaproteobacteria bacterium]|nr:RNase adapter RapZ [Alphaproteobacteria bacterium]
MVTGMSGAGKSTALKVFEDLGYEVVDNLPVTLIGGLVRGASGDADTRRPLAICTDVRTREFDVEHFERYLAPLLDRDSLDTTLLFLESDDEILRRRFTETRRRHPLADDRPVSDGIRLERERLIWARNRADLVVDTSGLGLPDLRRLLTGHFSISSAAGLGVHIVSFGYRHGLPPEADLVFDVRFLANPHYEPNLRAGTGLDAPIAAFIERDSAFAPFFATLTDMLNPLLPAYEREGKSYLTIAIGCTGGRHRSVFVAGRLVETLRAAGWTASLRHRDLERSASIGD